MAPNFYRKTTQSPEKLPQSPPKTIQYPMLHQDKVVGEEIDYNDDDELGSLRKALQNALNVNRTMQNRILQLEILKNESVPDSKENHRNRDSFQSNRNAPSDSNKRRAIVPNLTSKLNDRKEVSPNLWKSGGSDNARNDYLNLVMTPNQKFWDFYTQFRIVASTAGITQDLVLRSDLRDKVLTRLRSSVVNEWPRCKNLHEYAAALQNQDADYHARRSRNDRRNENQTASSTGNRALGKSATFVIPVSRATMPKKINELDHLVEQEYDEELLKYYSDIDAHLEKRKEDT
ncbi:hypothetical protein EPUL_005482 [Erysiphe pulchra]|uniref:Uncharacterized protein n=1 Tax=Erysiphe pulchra TaxID=225359 RepID=A0A2S4PMJ4_9PEZI|nr:hypothetical protein EPUL_005482 [Erysiphe pulchra]